MNHKRESHVPELDLSVAQRPTKHNSYCIFFYSSLFVVLFLTNPSKDVPYFLFLEHSSMLIFYQTLLSKTTCHFIFLVTFRVGEGSARRVALAGLRVHRGARGGSLQTPLATAPCVRNSHGHGHVILKIKSKTRIIVIVNQNTIPSSSSCCHESQCPRVSCCS